MTSADHQALIDLLMDIQGKVILSGYLNEMYRQLEHNAWYTEDFTQACELVGNTQVNGRKGKLKDDIQRTERLWMNFTPRRTSTGGTRHTVETKRKIAAARKGEKHSKETKRKIGKARRAQAKQRQLDQEQATTALKPTSAPRLARTS